MHRLVLANHVPLHDLLELEQLAPLALEHARDGDAGPAAHHGRNVVRGDRVVLRDAALFLLLALLLLQRLEALLQVGDRVVGQVASRGQVVAALGVRGLGPQLVDLAPDVVELVTLGALRLKVGLERRQLVLQLCQLLARLVEPLAALRVLLPLERVHGDLEPQLAALQVVDRLRHRLTRHGHVRAALVDQVNGCVGQLARGQVALRKLCGRDERTVHDAHAVVHLVLLADTTQDGNCVLHGGLLHQHLLEAAVQRGVLLDARAVFVERRGTDAAQLSAGKHGLEQVRRVHAGVAALARHDQVHLVDEQDARRAVVGHLFNVVEHGLDTLLVLALVLGPGHERAHVQREDLAQQVRRHIPVDHALRQALDHGRLTHTGVTNQHRVVLGTPREHADHPADLVVTPNHGVQLALGCQCGQVRTVLGQRVVAGFGALGVDVPPATRLVDRVAQQLGIRKTGALEQRLDRRVVHQREEDVVLCDERVPLLCLV